MYKQEEGTFRSSKDDFQIYWHAWLPAKGRTKRVLVVQHGFGEHCGRYQNVVQEFDRTETAIFALDSRGHGKTGGKRGHVDQFQLYVDDLADLIRLAREKTGFEKVILLGHSLGGVIALQYALEGTNESNLVALIVSAPAVEVQMDFEKRVKKFIGQALANFSPATTVDANLDLSFLSHDQSVIEAYRNDPLVHGKISFQMGKNMFSVGESIYQKVNHLTIPVYIFHGAADQIAAPRGSEKVFSLLTTGRKKLHIYDGLYHETMNELSPHKEEVLHDLREWILETERAVGTGAQKKRSIKKANKKVAKKKKAAKKGRAQSGAARPAKKKSGARGRKQASRR